MPAIITVAHHRIAQSGCVVSRMDWTTTWKQVTISKNVLVLYCQSPSSLAYTQTSYATEHIHGSDSNSYSHSMHRCWIFNQQNNSMKSSIGFSSYATTVTIGTLQSLTNLWKQIYVNSPTNIISYKLSEKLTNISEKTERFGDSGSDLSLIWTISHKQN